MTSVSTSASRADTPKLGRSIIVERLFLDRPSGRDTPHSWGGGHCIGWHSTPSNISTMRSAIAMSTGSAPAAALSSSAATWRHVVRSCRSGGRCRQALVLAWMADDPFGFHRLLRWPETRRLLRSLPYPAFQGRHTACNAVSVWWRSVPFRRPCLEPPVSTIFEPHRANRSSRIAKISTLPNRNCFELLVKMITASAIALGHANY